MRPACPSSPTCWCLCLGPGSLAERRAACGQRRRAPRRGRHLTSHPLFEVLAQHRFAGRPDGPVRAARLSRRATAGCPGRACPSFPVKGQAWPSRGQERGRYFPSESCRRPPPAQPGISLAWPRRMRDHENGGEGRRPGDGGGNRIGKAVGKVEATTAILASFISLLVSVRKLCSRDTRRVWRMYRGGCPVMGRFDPALTEAVQRDRRALLPGPFRLTARWPRCRPTSGRPQNAPRRPASAQQPQGVGVLGAPRPRPALEGQQPSGLRDGPRQGEGRRTPFSGGPAGPGPSAWVPVRGWGTACDGTACRACLPGGPERGVEAGRAARAAQPAQPQNLFPHRACLGLPALRGFSRSAATARPAALPWALPCRSHAASGWMDGWLAGRGGEGVSGPDEDEALRCQDPKSPKSPMAYRGAAPKARAFARASTATPRTLVLVHWRCAFITDEG